MRTINPYRQLTAVQRHGLELGTDVESGEPVYLPLKELETHLHLLGPPGVGKTRLLLQIFRLLCELPRATVIVFNPKGDFGRQARDAALAIGMKQRLVWFNPGEPDVVAGYNPLRPNGLAPATQAKAVREAIRAGWGQASFDSTPQMARLLFLLLYAARELQLDLVETLALLRSTRTPHIIQQLRDETLRAALVYFWSLGAGRRDELAASALARLESFVLDPTIRTILTAPAGLQLDEVLREHKILVVNVEQYRPLRADDVRLLGRFLVNDILAHVFAREPKDRTPVYLLIDEAQMFATTDLCTALDQGRELKLHCVLAHQHLGQLRQEDLSGQLFASIMQCARTKVVFGGLSAEDLDAMARDLFLEEFNPWTVKDELTSLELEPVESRRTSLTWGGNIGETFTNGRNWGDSEEENESYGQTIGRGIQRGTTVTKSLGISEATTRGRSHGWTHAWTEAESYARSRGISSTTGEGTAIGSTKMHSHTSGRSVGELESAGHASGLLLSSVAGETFPGDGSAVSPLTTSLTHGQATSEVHSSGEGHSEVDVQSDSYGEASSEMQSFSRSRTVVMAEMQAVHRGKQYGVQDVVSESETVGQQASIGRADSQGSSETVGLSHQAGESRGRSEGENQSRTRGRGASWSRTISPFTNYKKRRVVSSRTFLSQEEFFALKAQRLQKQQTAQFVLKRPTKRAQFVQAARVEPPVLTERRRQEGLAQVFSAPYYTPRATLPEPPALPPPDFPEDVWEAATNPQVVPLDALDDRDDDR